MQDSTKQFFETNYSLEDKTLTHYKYVQFKGITMAINNLLNQKKIMKTSSFNSESEVFKLYKPGSTIKFKINYQI